MSCFCKVAYNDIESACNKHYNKVYKRKVYRLMLRYQLVYKHRQSQKEYHYSYKYLYIIKELMRKIKCKIAPCIAECRNAYIFHFLLYLGLYRCYMFSQILCLVGDSFIYLFVLRLFFFCFCQPLLLFGFFYLTVICRSYFFKSLCGGVGYLILGSLFFRIYSL